MFKTQLSGKICTSFKEESFRHVNPLKDEILSKFKKVKKINNDDTDDQWIDYLDLEMCQKVHNRVLLLSNAIIIIIITVIWDLILNLGSSLIEISAFVVAVFFSSHLLYF